MARLLGVASPWKPWTPLLMLLLLRQGARAFQSRYYVHRLSTSLHSSSVPPEKVAIVGGGLAGLSTAFHLLELRSQKRLSSPLDLTIFDKEPVGQGGASAVAGGLVHPLSPRGKLLHWGMEGLQATNQLVDEACQATNRKDVVLRSEIFRLATTPKQVDQLQTSAQLHPDICQWMEPGVLAERLGSSGALGGLRLHNGCKVLHLPSYLKGLWAACQTYAGVSVQWKEQDLAQLSDWEDDYDAVVWAAGSGIFENGPIKESSLPVQLVRGQSAEVRLAETVQLSHTEALLSGKYISPLPEPNRVLVGATHEFQMEPMSGSQVKQLLQDKTESFASHVWAEGAVVERYTTGTRVQSQRGSRGRLPIVGRLEEEKHWIFTGLSSRGLLYHAVYGKVLAQAIWEGSEECLKAECLDYDWWRPK